MTWLPDMDLNHDKQIQSLLCYRYTIGQMAGPQRRDFPGPVKLGDPANCRRDGRRKKAGSRRGASGFGHSSFAPGIRHLASANLHCPAPFAPQPS